MKNNVEITVLVDNEASHDLCCEWGLSLVVRRGGTNVLLDFGQSPAFAQNAACLGVDLAAMDFAVLSHAHYDHANGMPSFFEHNTTAPLYLSEACAENCWSTKRGTTPPHYIGIKPGLLNKYRDRLRFIPTGTITTIAPGIHIVPHSTPGLANKGIYDGMLLRMQDVWQPDGFSHEVSLVIELGDDADAPLAILNSCSHAGVDAIVGEVAKAFPTRHIRTFVGGLHLFQSTDEEILRVAQCVRDAGIAHLYIGHCTGEHALGLLQSELPDRVSKLFCGLTF